MLALLKAGADAKYSPDLGELISSKSLHEPLSVAVQFFDLEIIRSLVNAGANVCKLGAYNHPQIFYALQSYDMKTKDLMPVVSYLREVADEELKGKGTIVDAARFGATERLKQLASTSKDINVTDPDGRTSLSYAAEFGFVDLVEILLEHGAAPAACGEGRRVPDDVAHPALVYAAGGLCTNAIYSVNQGKLAKQQHAIVRRMAAKAGNKETVNLLLERGADLQLKDRQGVDAAKYARKANHKSLADFLTKATTGSSSLHH